MSKKGLTTREAVAYLASLGFRVSESFMRSFTRGVTGNRTPPPPHYKIGKWVRYDQADLDAWLDERRVDPAQRARQTGRKTPRPTTPTSPPEVA
jgi:hypothetical protein